MKQPTGAAFNKGRPMYYRTPEALQTAVDAYFKSCEGELICDEHGAPLLDKKDRLRYRNRRPVTMTGLAISLGFTSRRALLNYKYRPGFDYVYKRALLRCETYAEEALFTRDGYAGAAFTLRRCFGWDKLPTDDNHQPVQIVICDDPMRDGTNPTKNIGLFNILLYN